MPSHLLREHQKKSKKIPSPTKTSTPPDMNKVACIVLGGGRGSRLFPLTTKRSKPAICLGGRYRLIDIPLSNALNSGIHKIFVVTQFLSASIHRHVYQTYQLGRFSNGFIDLLSAEQKPSHHMWYQGTADAVRQNLPYFMETPAQYFLILSGDQIYNFDFSKMVAFAKQTDAEMVIASLPVDKKQARRMGILKIDANRTITDFYEKPQEDEILERFIVEEGMKPFLGSMGIYLFKREAMFRLLEEDSREDFGCHLIPTIVSKGTASAYIHDGYWEDIGTIDTFYKANIALTMPTPTIDLYNEERPIYACKYNLPGPKIEDTKINHSLLCEGVRCQAEEVSNSILGPRSVIGKETTIKKSYLMGNDFYTLPVPDIHHPSSITIGKNCHLEKVILDKNVTLGDNVSMTNPKNLQYFDGEGVYIRDGIIVVTRGAHIPSNYTL